MTDLENFREAQIKKAYLLKLATEFNFLIDRYNLKTGAYKKFIGKHDAEFDDITNYGPIQYLPESSFADLQRELNTVIKKELNLLDEKLINF